MPEASENCKRCHKADTPKEKNKKYCSCATFASRSRSCKAWTHDKFCCGKTSLQLLYLQVEMLWWGIRQNSGCLMLFGRSILMVPRGPRYSSKAQCYPTKAGILPLQRVIPPKDSSDRAATGARQWDGDPWALPPAARALQPQALPAVLAAGVWGQHATCK